MAKENGPLDKFDQYMKKKTTMNLKTVEWELAHHFTHGCRWCGHCHGWAAAAILEREPTSSTVKLEIPFAVGDLKGLLTEVHCTDSIDLWRGQRGWSGRNDWLEAHVFHWVLLNWVGNGEPVVMDIEKRPEVWNHPAYKFEMTSQPDGADSEKTHVTCKVWFVTDGVPPDYVGTKAFSRTYKYWIKGDFKNPSAGDWEQGDHPGFIWHPDYVNITAAGANPATKYYYSHIRELTQTGIAMIFAVSDLKAYAPIGSIIPDMGPDGPVNPLLFRGLVSLHGSRGHAVPFMAASWDVSDNDQVYVFHLQDGALFHDGTPVTAEDVVFTYTAILDPDFGSPYREALQDVIETVEAVDENTIRFKLTKPMRTFPKVHGWYWILPQHVINQVGIEAFSANPVGSGPFAFESREPDRLTLVAFSDYFLGNPLLNQITFVEARSVTQRLNLIEEGGADVALFDYSAQVKRRAEALPHVDVFAIPAGAPRRLEVQSIRLTGRTPNEFDGAWNILKWDINLEAPGPRPVAPESELVRRLIARGEERFTDAAPSFEWRKGVWWQIEVRQKALAAGVSDPGWTLPFHIVFEIIDEEVVEDTLCYKIQVTYPDRPRSAEHKYAHVWASKDEHALVKGVLHIGSRTIPMQYDFLTELLEMTPTERDAEEVDAEKMGTLPDPRRADEKVNLKTFEKHTVTGGKCLLSPDAPFPLRIEEPTYTVELQNWGLAAAHASDAPETL